MDFYISSLAARIPCTRLHRQIQDPRGRSIMAFAVSNDGKIAAMATYPREQRSVESSVNVLFKDGKASRTSNYHKAVQRQRRLAERNNEIEYNVDHYIQQTLQMDALGHAVKEVGLSTPSLRHIIKDNNNNNNAESSYPCQPFLPCAVIMYDTMYFNPVEEFIYGYVRNNNFRRNMHREHRPAESNISESCNKPLQTGVPSTSKCLFKPTSVEFCCDDSLLVLTSSDSGAKVFALDTEYVELLCHYRPRLKDELCLESFKVLKCNVVLEDVRGTVPKIPECFLDHKAICQPCKAAVITDADNYKEEALPYTVILECIVCVTSQPPFLGVLYSKWPSGEVSMVAVQYLCSPLDISTIGHDFLISHFKTRTTKTKEFAVLNHIQKYWFLEPYIHDHIEYLIQCDKPLKSGYNKTLLSTEVGSKDYLEFHSLIALYSPDYNLYIMNQKGNILSHTTVPALEEGYFNIDVSGDGSMIAMIGAESIVIYHVLLWREENGAISVILDQHTRFPQVIGVGRREEILCACFGKDPGNRWMYVSVARGSVDAVLYVVDIALSKEKEPIKRTLNMNSSIFPCVVSMVAMNNFLIVMPRHQRFLTQLTQEHTDNSDDIYSRQFCHFPVLATNKEAITVNAEIDDIDEPAKDRFEILTLERKRQISLQNKPSCRINVSRWLDALYQYNALCMYKGRSITLGMDPHDFLLPPLRRVRQQFPFAYDAKQFYDPLVGLEFIGSPALMRAQCYEWVREAIARAGFMNQMLPLNVVYDHKLHMLDYVYAKICISQCDNPSEYLFSLRTNDFLRLQLINFPKISQRLDIPCDAQGLIPYDSSMIYKRIREVMPMVLSEYKMHPVPPKSRENLEREAFDIMRDQLLPELMDIPMPKVRKIIRDRLYRLRKKLAQLESYKFDGPTSAAHHEFYLDEIVRSDCRLPAFKDNVDPREVAMNEYAMRLRMKVLSSFYKMQRDDGPNFDEYRQ